MRRDISSLGSEMQETDCLESERTNAAKFVAADVRRRTREERARLRLLVNGCIRRKCEVTIY